MTDGLPATPAGPPPRRRRRRSSRLQVKTGIVRDELIPKPCREAIRAEAAEIIVEVAELRAKHQG